MTTIHKDGELDPGGPSEGGDGIHRGPDTTSREEHIVDQDQWSAVEINRKFGQLQNTHPGSGRKIVPVHRDIDNPKGRRDSLDLRDMGNNPAC